MSAIVHTTVERRGAASPRVAEDDVVVEEPLAIRVHGDTLAVTMRTPGHDRELVLGFLLAEGVIRARDDVASLAPCTREPNVIDVTLAPGVHVPEDDDAPFAKRGTLTTSACGVCGRRAIGDLLARVRPVARGPLLAARTLVDAVASLRAHQPVFGATGGCHAASLVGFDGAVIGTYEDVGRHNAVDKAVGARVRAGALPLSATMLVVSGRSSFEIVQKAAAAGLPVVAAVSAPTSLAVDLARAADVTLVGFARGDRFTVYAGGERITP